MGVPSAAANWATAVAGVARAPVDITTLGRWAGLVNMSRSTLCTRCRCVSAGAKDSLALGRLARTLMVGDPRQWFPEHWLDVADERTLMTLLRRAGLSEHRHRRRPPLEALLSRHQFAIPRATGWVLATLLPPPLPER